MEAILNWRTVMMGMVVGVALVCGLILLFRRMEASAARWLGLFLILGALSMGPQVIGYAGAYDAAPWLTFFPLFYAETWMGPLLVAHAHALMKGGPLGWRRWLFLPGAVFTAYYIYAFAFLDGGMFDHLPKWDFNDAVHEPFVSPLESMIGISLIIFALVIIWRKRRDYLAYLENTESAARDYDPVWLRNLIFAVGVGAVIYAGIEIAEIAFDPSYDAAFPFQVLLMAVFAWIGLDAAWRLTRAFPKMSRKVHITREGNAEEDWASRLQSAMQSERWYLEPRLSIRDVARRLGTNESYVSRALNTGLGQSFNAYVNGLRVEHAQARMRDSRDPVLQIAMDSGFNSKATFNRVFRELSGQTPSQFRKTSQNP